jgi:PAS domain S-box-containing protein
MNGEAFGFEAIFEALVETIPEPVFFTDLEGSILSISQRAVDMLGYPSYLQLLSSEAQEILSRV